MDFTFKTCQIVADRSMTTQFHEFLECNFWRVFCNLSWMCATPPPYCRRRRDFCRANRHKSDLSIVHRWRLRRTCSTTYLLQPLQPLQPLRPLHLEACQLNSWGLSTQLVEAIVKSKKKKRKMGTHPDVDLYLEGTDYGRPMKPFFNNISNFWAWVDK